MARLCERPGCSQPADVIYGIDADHLVVWIESLDRAITHRAGVLCRRHADAMVVPLGWMLDDRREAVPRLFKPRESPPPPRPRARRHRATGRDETGQLELDPATIPEEEATAPSTAPPATDSPPAPVPASAPMPAPAPAAAAAPEAAPAAAEPRDPVAPWKPKFDQTDDLDGLLVARSPLLSRAFGKRDQPPD